LPERKTVAADKPATEAKVTSIESKPAETAKQTTVQDNSKNAVPEAAEPLAQTGKKNLLPTIIVLSIVIGCIAIVSVRKKIN
jgi:hypothetical protein